MTVFMSDKFTSNFKLKISRAISKFFFNDTKMFFQELIEMAKKDLERKKAEQKRKSSRTKSSNVDEDKDEVSAAEEDDIEEADEDEEVESGSGKLV